MTVISAIGFAQPGKKRFEREVEKSCQLIAMLSIDYKGTPVFGAGIVFGRQKDSLLIATAYHLLHYGGTQPDNIEVRLKTAPDVVLNATVLKYSGDKKMDLAVLRVKNNIPGGKCGIAFRQVSNYERERGDEVYAVGNPNGVPWIVPIEPDDIVQTVKNEIVFQSAFISIGNSGGGLLDEDGRFIGMITSDQAPYGRAIDIEAVLAQVKRWGCPVELDTVAKRFTSTPLHLAVKNGNKTEIKQLLENCAELNVDDENHEYPLHIAVRGGNLEVISLLVKAGANMENPGGHTLVWPINIAVKANRIDILNLLLKAGASPKGHFGCDFSLTPLANAIDSANFPIIDILLAAGVNVNEPDETDDYALTYAVSKKAKLTVLKKLLSAGANPNIANEINIRKSPFGCAVDLQNIEAMELLVEAGANINAKDKNGNTPLSYAMQDHDDRSVAWLLAHGAKK